MHLPTHQSEHNPHNYLVCRAVATRDACMHTRPRVGGPSMICSVKTVCMLCLCRGRVTVAQPPKHVPLMGSGESGGQTLKQPIIYSLYGPRARSDTASQSETADDAGVKNS